VYRLAGDCVRDAVVRKFVAPALELVMLGKALKGEFDEEKALLWFGEMYATAVAGDGSVGPREVELAVGGELGGGAALLRLATLSLLNELLPDELKFGVHTYAVEGSYRIATYGEDAARFMRLLAVSAPSAGGGYLSDKFNEFTKETQVEVQLDKNSIRETEKGVAADLTISVSGVAVKYNVYLSENAIKLQFISTDRSRAELAARLLRLAGVSAEVKKEDGRDKWYVYAYTDKLAAGREELRKALADFVRSAVKNEKKAERWLKKLEEGRVLMEGWPKYNIQLTKGALEVRFGSPNSDSIEREAQRLEKMGLKRGVHFSVKMPEGGKNGYVNILKDGLARAAWLSVYGKDEEQRRLAAKFVKLILNRAEEAGYDVYEKAQKIIEEGMSRRSQTLRDLEKWVEVNGKTYVVKVIGGEAIEEERDGRKLLRIKITAEVICVGDGCIVDRVEREYTITYSRHARSNAAVGRAYARADAPGGRKADAERLSVLVEALTGEEPRIRRIKNGKIRIECYGGHLEGFMGFTELADVIERWLEETSRR